MGVNHRPTSFQKGFSWAGETMQGMISLV